MKRPRWAFTGLIRWLYVVKIGRGTSNIATIFLELLVAILILVGILVCIFVQIIILLGRRNAKDGKSTPVAVLTGMYMFYLHNHFPDTKLKIKTRKGADRDKQRIKGTISRIR